MAKLTSVPVLRRAVSPATIFEPFRRTESLFDRFFNDFFTEVNGESVRAAPTDIYETPESVVIEMAVPGYTPENIDISIEGNRVTLSGRRENGEESRDRNYLLKELAWGAFTRQFTIPVELNPEGARAEFKGGLLHLNIPKADTVRARKIEIKTT